MTQSNQCDFNLFQTLPKALYLDITSLQGSYVGQRGREVFRRPLGGDRSEEQKYEASAVRNRGCPHLQTVS